jgi:hypothetical protein
MAHYTQITALVSVLAPSGSLTTPTAATIANAVGQAASFDLRVARDLPEATEVGDDFRQWARGVGEWDGTLTLHYDAKDVNEHQDELFERLLPNDFAATLNNGGAAIQVNWWIDSTAGAGASIAYYGAMLVQEANFSVGSGMTTAVLRCIGNGAVKYSGVLL